MSDGLECVGCAAYVLSFEVGTAQFTDGGYLIPNTFQSLGGFDLGNGTKTAVQGKDGQSKIVRNDPIYIGQTLFNPRKTEYTLKDLYLAMTNGSCKEEHQDGDGSLECVQDNACKVIGDVKIEVVTYDEDDGTKTYTKINTVPIVWASDCSGVQSTVYSSKKLEAAYTDQQGNPVTGVISVTDQQGNTLFVCCKMTAKCDICAYTVE